MTVNHRWLHIRCKPQSVRDAEGEGRENWNTLGTIEDTFRYLCPIDLYWYRVSVSDILPVSADTDTFKYRKLRRTTQDAFHYVFGPESFHKSYSLRAAGSNNEWKKESLFSTNSKETMTFLNDRLANYLEQVAKLKEENNRLERNIQAWNEKNAPKELPNYKSYFKIIEGLQKEPEKLTSPEDRKISLPCLREIPQRKRQPPTYNDLIYFFSRYSMELSLRNNIEADIKALRKGLDGLTSEKSDLEFQINFLMEDLSLLKKSHIEDSLLVLSDTVLYWKVSVSDGIGRYPKNIGYRRYRYPIPIQVNGTQISEVNSLETQLGARVNVEVNAAPSVDMSKILLKIRTEYENLMEENTKDVENWFKTQEVNSLETQLGARVNVEVNAAPSVDMSKILLKIRTEYENLMEENTKDVENWFKTQSEELNQHMISGTEQLQTVKSEVIDLRHTIQTLEIDLHADISKKLALEGSLVETEDDYGSQLAYIQGLVNNVEAEFSRLRYDLERQQHEYKILMDARTRLEMEIATYRRLLQEEDMYVGRKSYCVFKVY
ncbi:unnamed protein product [Ranitomeya imitator]|uniref:IF rod domain-containing protein n=1 Tax=Ranitomeya imitator TaxID=111125 RepID=A0ABN9L5K9_9NEOB|nr:unnamed protein product [Ranitomeya imitator]